MKIMLVMCMQTVESLVINLYTIYLYSERYSLKKLCPFPFVLMFAFCSLITLFWRYFLYYAKYFSKYL